jgi:hypothetical protein
MRNAGNSVIMPEESEREKKMSAFKTISFLLSPPETESFSDYSGTLNGDKDPPANAPDPMEVGKYGRIGSE